MSCLMSCCLWWCLLTAWSNHLMFSPCNHTLYSRLLMTFSSSRLTFRLQHSLRSALTIWTFYSHSCANRCVSSALAAGSLLCIHHPVCGPSVGCRNGPHGGLSGLPKPVDTFWTHAALVGSTPSCLQCDSRQLEFAFLDRVGFLSSILLQLQCSCLCPLACW